MNLRLALATTGHRTLSPTIHSASDAHFKNAQGRSKHSRPLAALSHFAHRSESAWTACSRIGEVRAYRVVAKATRGREELPPAAGQRRPQKRRCGRSLIWKVQSYLGY
jgi:hypothetical protein